MKAVGRLARAGGLVLGICNGFQILLEAGLLPGAMLRNKRLRFLCRQVHVRVENKDTPFTCAARPGQVLEMPIAHMEGNYFCDAETLAELERNRQIIFRYATRTAATLVLTISRRIRMVRSPQLPASRIAKATWRA